MQATKSVTGVLSWNGGGAHHDLILFTGIWDSVGKNFFPCTWLEFPSNTILCFPVSKNICVFVSWFVRDSIYCKKWPMKLFLKHLQLVTHLSLLNDPTLTNISFVKWRYGYYHSVKMQVVTFSRRDHGSRGACSCSTSFTCLWKVWHMLRENLAVLLTEKVNERWRYNC